MAEGIAIVASILIAFALDAWWDDRQESARETALLSRLHAESEENLRRLLAARGTHEDALLASDSLFRLIAIHRGSAPPATVDSLLLRAINTRTFDPASGTLNAVLATGDLNLIRDDSIRTLVAGWPDLVTDLREEQILDFNMSWEFIPLSQRFVFWSPIGGLSYRVTQNYEGLLTSREVAGALDNLSQNRRVILDESSVAETTLLALMQRIEESGVLQGQR
jgi:hypothetical protein